MNSDIPAACEIDTTLQEHVNNYLADAIERTGVPGISAALSIRGKRIAASAGSIAIQQPCPLSSNTHFHLGCFTKLLSALVILELAWTGRLDLHVPIADYLPELCHSRFGGSVTLAHLLSHTSGYLGQRIYAPRARQFTWDRFVEYLESAHQYFSPGEVYSHEHIGFPVADQIVERVTGKRLSELTRKLILEPLDISLGTVDIEDDELNVQAGRHDFNPATDSYVQVDWSKYFDDYQLPIPHFWHPALSAKTIAVVDLVTIGESLINSASGSGPDHDMFSTPTLSQLQRPLIQLPTLVEGPLNGTMPLSFGLGAARYPSGLYGVTSRSLGQSMAMRFDPTSQICIAAACNASNPFLPDLLIDRICSSTAGLSPVDQQRTPLSIEPKRLCGLYRGCGKQSASIHMNDKHLVCQIGQQDSKHRPTICVDIDADGYATVANTDPHNCIGFFEAPHSGSIGIMIGPMAYRKVSDE